MMMPRSSDLIMKRFAQAFGESAMESLKQAIMVHELTFRNQVRELHRLYWTQKNLMNELTLLKNHQRNFNPQFPADDVINMGGNCLDNNNNLSETDLSNASETFDIEKGLLSSGVSGRNESINLKDSMNLEGHEGVFQDQIHFGVGQDRRLQKQGPNVSSIGHDNSSMAYVNDHSSKTHEFGPVLIDLNVRLEDESFHHQDDPRIKIPIPSMDSSAVPPEFIRFQPTEIHPTISLSPIRSCFDNKLDINAAYVNDNKRQNTNITSSNSINLRQSVNRDATEKVINHEESEEDTISSHAIVEEESEQDALLIKFSFEYKSNGMSESSSYEKGADESVITMYEEQDIASVAAAETLMTISFGRRENDEPQSSDSFESMTMHLTEIENEESNVVMPDTLSVNEAEKDEKRNRPRRGGRRLQDFQKKILPGLVSLSRHEICEDLYNISYKVRRNEFTSAAGSFFVPVRSRRSRSFSGRRMRPSFQWFQAGE